MDDRDCFTYFDRLIRRSDVSRFVWWRSVFPIILESPHDRSRSDGCFIEEKSLLEEAMSGSDGGYGRGGGGYGGNPRGC
ncbi:hypothetical protein QJS10_CPB21g01396 [Acorus calamus]|uniref:Glycine-rich protein n=1 Tax=Acorus calamus TaxID=4465 RepID=A0AAV9C3S8_ACOCL|nr:hypothetical protein QJS10_CPB21g01396 [Acorus calamus]